MRSYFCFIRGEKRRHSHSSGEYFQRSIKQKEQAKWIDYYFPEECSLNSKKHSISIISNTLILKHKQIKVIHHVSKSKVFAT